MQHELVIGTGSKCPWYEREPGADMPTEEDLDATRAPLYGKMLVGWQLI
jgi:hypothetical protein